MKYVLHYIRPRTAKTESSWMIIFADLLALLMTFFVMMLSMNTPQSAKWNSMIAGFSDAFNPARQTISIEQNKNSSSAKQMVEKPSISIDYLSALFEDAIKPYKNVLGVHVSRLEGKVVISLPAYFLLKDPALDYASHGKDPELNRDATVLIANLTSILEQLGNEIAIVGHVAPNYEGASQWVQSLKMARSVERLILKSGYNGEMNIYGLGASRFEYIDPSILSEVRLKIADRVDIEVKDYLREAVVDAGV